MRTTLALPISVTCRLCSPTVLGSQRSVLAPLLRAQVESFARMIFSGWYQVAKLQAEQARQDEAAALQQRTEALAAELAASVSSAAQSAQQQAEHAQQEEQRSAQPYGSVIPHQNLPVSESPPGPRFTSHAAWAVPSSSESHHQMAPPMATEAPTARIVVPISSLSLASS